MRILAEISKSPMPRIRAREKSCSPLGIHIAYSHHPTMQLNMDSVTVVCSTVDARTRVTAVPHSTTSRGLRDIRTNSICPGALSLGESTPVQLGDANTCGDEQQTKQRHSKSTLYAPRRVASRRGAWWMQSTISRHTRPQHVPLRTTDVWKEHARVLLYDENL
ncbi:hypothetical protein BKA93DRAFT_354344 [Sparassis latifolia]